MQIPARPLAGLLIVTGALAPPGAVAADLDDAGFLRVGALAEGFETSRPAVGTLQGAVPGRDTAEVLDRAATLALGGIEPGVPLEGQTALALAARPGRLASLTWLLDGVAPRGHRVEVRLWQRAEGTRARASLVWWAGDRDALRTARTGALFNLATVLLVPTGRRSDDGWEELTSGPVDAWLAGQVPPTLLVQDDLGPGGPSDDRRVLLDALEVLDLGPGPVADGGACGAATDTCGPRAACRYGRCVDAAVVDGPRFPLDAHRAQYFARREAELDLFLGHRAARRRWPGQRDALRALGEGAAPANLWRRYAGVLDGLGDGHIRGPAVTGASSLGAGACAHLGIPDLLAGQPARLPLVYAAAPTHPETRQLRPGDVLVALDGRPVAEWRQHMQEELRHSGDPEVRDFAVSAQLLGLAALHGSTATFARCAGPAACATPERIEVDYARAAEPLWADEIPAWAGASVPCDPRFVRLAGDRDIASSGHVASTRIGDDTRVLQINATLGDSFGDYSAWRRGVDEALVNPAPRLLLDQRRGDGGSFQGLHYLTSFFFDRGASPIDVVFGVLGPRDAELRTPLSACARSAATGYLDCGGTQWVTTEAVAPDGPAPGSARASRLAILTGLDVSGNDWLTDHLRRRRPPGDGDTRVFGPAPTFGAFGEVVSLPRHRYAYAGPRLQWTGGVVVFGPNEDLIADLDGRGVRPDVVVHQTQSDAVRGVDTQIEEALRWLTATP